MRRPLLFKKKTEPEQASPFFRKKSDEQFFSTNADQSRSELEQGSDQVNALSKDTQGEMGAALGGDFTNVKIHTGPKAEQMSEAMNAHAFTYGKDIYFNKNMFNDNTRQGKMLLAHELVHTMQQQHGNAEGATNEQATEAAANAHMENAAAGLSGNEKSSSYKSGKGSTLSSTGLHVQRCAKAPDSEPEVGRWKTKVDADSEGAGWKHTLTFAGFLARNPPRNVLCYLLVGVPGYVSDAQADVALASAVTESASVVNAELNMTDPSHSLPTGTICNMFRQQVLARMKTAIPGARVQSWNY